MKASIIIPTYNGIQRIYNVLAALSLQTFREFETIVVIDGSKDGTETFLKNLKIDLQFKYHIQGNKGRAAVRNTGASLARGEILIFFDDDMRPAPDCVEEHVQHHELHSASLMSGAQIDDLNKARTPFEKYKCFLSEQWAEPLQKFKDKPLPLGNLHLTAANFSITRHVFDALGGFDEALRDNEDFDLAMRAFQQGYSVYYRHTAFAWHDDLPSCKSFIKRQREYRTYHDYVNENKKEVFGTTGRFASEKLSFRKSLFYSFWKSNGWVTLADKGFFRWIPKKIQYKIYDWIVYAQLIKA